MAMPDMAEPLYTRDILRLAADSADLVRIAAADGTAEARSPVCGSRMTADVCLGDDGRITAFGGAVNACAMGQASATLFARHAQQLAPCDVAKARSELSAYLSGSADVPPWPDLTVFAPVRTRPARHPAILLPFDATLAAIGEAR